MIGTIRYINEKEGKRGKYLTLALEDGTKGLVVNDEKIMEAVKEGETYNFTVEKSGIFTIVTGIATESDQDKPEEQEMVFPDELKTKKQPIQKTAPKPQAGTHKSEYMKRRVPEEQLSIARQAFGKALIEAYARLWAVGKISFDDTLQFNNKIRLAADVYVEWLEIEEK